MSRSLLAAVLLVALLCCTDGGGEQAAPPAAPTLAPPADETPDAASPDVEAALAAAAVWRAARPECEGGGFVDEYHHPIAERSGALLVYVACFLGAYQPNGEVLAYDGQLEAWPVEQWTEGTVREAAEVVGDVYETPDGLLENLQQYRSLGDCGLLQRWEVGDERLELVEAREQPCDAGGSAAPPPAWPLVHGG